MVGKTPISRRDHGSIQYSSTKDREKEEHRFEVVSPSVDSRKQFLIDDSRSSMLSSELGRTSTKGFGAILIDTFGIKSGAEIVELTASDK